MQPALRISPAADIFSRRLAERTNAVWHKDGNGDYLSQDICPGGLRGIMEAFDALRIRYTLHPNADGSARLFLSHAMTNQFLMDARKPAPQRAALGSDKTGRVR